MGANDTLAGLDRDQLNECLKLYDIETYLFDQVSKRFEDDGTLEPFDFFAIVVWKSNRAKTKIKKGLEKAGKSVSELMAEVSQAVSLKDKVRILWDIDGIGLSIASAILAVCYPEVFTVLDYRVWEVLTKAAVQGLPTRSSWYPEDYLQYCEVCRRLADRMDLSLRDLDRALWAKSWRDDLRELVQGLKTCQVWGEVC